MPKEKVQITYNDTPYDIFKKFAEADYTYEEFKEEYKKQLDELYKDFLKNHWKS